MLIIRAIHNMCTELFNIDIFNEISNANMLSFQGFSSDNSAAKFTSTFRKITLAEDKLEMEANPKYNIFKKKYYDQDT